MKGDRFTPSRVEKVEVSQNIVKNLLENAQNRPIPATLDPLLTRIQLRECHGHKNMISHITVESEHKHVLTCSADFLVRIWSFGFDLWGSIN